MIGQEAHMATRTRRSPSSKRAAVRVQQTTTGLVARLLRAVPVRENLGIAYVLVMSSAVSSTWAARRPCLQNVRS